MELKPFTEIVKPNQAIIGVGHRVINKAVAKLCHDNFLVFQKVELGMEIGPQHKMWWRRLKTHEDVCEMAPRDHGKSMSLARAYPIWRAKYDPWCRDILILGADQPSAVDNLDKIKIYMAESPSLSYLLPKNKGDGQFSRTEVLLKNGVNIKAKGIGSPLRGRHPQLIVLDDILNEKNSSGQEQMAAIENFFYEVVYPMKDKGLPKLIAAGFYSNIVTIGTAQNGADLYHKLQASPGFLGEKLKAVMNDDVPGKEVVLWSERYSYADLMKIKGTVGALHFSKEYQNTPLSEETSIFPPSLFTHMLDTSLSYVKSYNEGLPVYMGVDFSVPGSTDGDWTVIYVVAYDEPNATFIPLDYWRARPTTIQEQLHKIELMCSLYNVTTGYLEDNLFQRIYAEHFKNRTSLPLVGNTVTHSGKNSLATGVLAFRPMFENGVFNFPYKTAADKAKTDHMITEFNGVVQRRGKIGNENFHDDTVMAMWHAISASRGSTFSASWD